MSDSVFQKMGMNLHQRPDHPLCILKDAIYTYFDKEFPSTYKKFDSLYPVVSTRAVSLHSLSLCKFPYQAHNHLRVSKLSLMLRDQQSSHLNLDSHTWMGVPLPGHGQDAGLQLWPGARSPAHNGPHDTCSHSETFHKCYFWGCIAYQ